MFHSLGLTILEEMLISVLTISLFPLLALPAFSLTFKNVRKQMTMNGTADWVSSDFGKRGVHQAQQTRCCIEDFQSKYSKFLGEGG